MKKVYPAPEALSKGRGAKDWDVRPGYAAPGQACVSFTPDKAIMQVPLGDSPLAQAIRAHELGHGQYSPIEGYPDLVAEFGAQAVAAVEEARVNYILTEHAKVNLTELAFGEDEYVWGRFDAESDPEPYLHQAMASFGSGRLTALDRARAQAYADIQGPLDSEANQARMRALERIREASSRAYNYIQNYSGHAIINNEPEYHKLGLLEALKVLQGVANQDRREKAQQEASESLKSEGMDEELADHIAKMANRNYPDDGEFTGWGTVRWDHRPLIKRMMGHMGRDRTPARSGARLRHAERLILNRRAFTKRRPEPGGTLLFDLSGSMSLSAEQVQAVLDAAPGATIVGYSGDGGRGIMYSIARNGHHCDVDKLMCDVPGGNVIDGPALEWLAKQEEPRIWVSDGIATGRSDHYSTQGAQICQTIAKRNHIVQVGNPTYAVKYLKYQGRAQV